MKTVKSRRWHLPSGAGPGHLAHGRSPPARQAEVAPCGWHGPRLQRLRHRRDVWRRRSRGGARQALAAALRAALMRDKLFVVTKVYPHNASAKGVVAACERSLQRLQLDHIDLYLLHWRGADRCARRCRASSGCAARADPPLGRQQFRSSTTCGNSLRARRHVLRRQSGVVLAVERGIEFDLLPWQRSGAMPLMAYCPIDQGSVVAQAALAALAQRAWRHAGAAARWPGCCARRA